jgi:hypothetical protein
MALQKQITLDNGVTLTEAYIKIASFEFSNKASDVSYVRLEVNVFKDKTARDSGRPEVTKFVHKIGDPLFTEYFSLSILNQVDKNMISQAYSYLKTMSVYSGAMDIQDDKE